MTFQVWMFWLAGAALGGAGAFLICWGLFSDRLSGNWKKRRCRKCLYDMTSVTGLKCPECGRAWSREAEMHRVRRRWGMATLGLVLAISGFGLNWFAAGLVLGWTNVAPTAFLVRLSPVIGREAALRSVVAVGGRGFPSAPPIEAVSDWTLVPVERLAIRVLEDKQAAFPEVHAAVDALYWMRERLTQPQYIVGLLMEQVPGRSMPIATWTILFYSILVHPEIDVPLDKILDAAASNKSDLHGLASQLISSGLSRRGAEIVPDLLSKGLVYGVTWPELEYAHPETLAVLLKRCREVYFAGDDEVKKRLSRFLWPNAKFIPAGNADVEAMAREQIERFTCGEQCEFLDMNSFVLWQAGEALSGLLPEIGGMLSSPSAEARKRASGILRTIKAENGRELVLTRVVCGVIENGSDMGRAAAVDIVKRRSEVDRENVADAIVSAAGRVTTPVTLETMLRFAIPTSAESGVTSLALGEERMTRLEAILRKQLAADGPTAAVSAEWIGKLPGPDAESIALLEHALTDPTKSRDARIAARDALLRIRDRQQPGIDPAVPIRP